MAGSSNKFCRFLYLLGNVRNSAEVYLSLNRCTIYNMQIWQRVWLIIALAFFSFHTIRDILQQANVNTLIATFLVKKDKSEVPSWYWKVFNEYLIEVTVTSLSLYCLWTNGFGWPGYLTILLTAFFEIVWLIYWFFF